MTNINAKPITNSLPKVKKPTCPRHLGEMAFDIQRSIWSCQFDGCKVVARHKEEQSVVAPKKPAVNELKPTWLRLEVGRGADEEPTYTLFVNDRNTTYAIDVSDYTEMVIEDAAGEATLCLIISDVSH